MSTNKGEGFGNKPIVVILGLIASCIAIFAFITGKQSILDLIGTPVYKPTPKNTPVSTTVIPTSAIHAEDTTIPESPTQVVLMPTSLPMLIDNANLGVSISIQNLPNLNSGQGNVRIQFLTGNEPLRNYEILFMEASQDITGRWTIVEGQPTPVQTPNENGIVEASLAPGNYAVWNDNYAAGYNPLHGSWGTLGYFFDYPDPYQMILFPIQNGKLTNIKVSLARLEIGVINKSGNAMKELLVYLYCQGKDVANKTIPVECGDGENVQKTDYTGLAIFNVGTGTYTIKVLSDDLRDSYFFYDISVSPGEIRREILTIP